jgi:hypothetical protein
MPCDFHADTCAIDGNFLCKKCTSCGYTVSLPGEAAEQHWPAVLENVKKVCPHNKTTENQITVDAVAVSPTPDETPPPSDPTANLPDPFGIVAQKVADEHGPGAYLKKYLRRIGITATPNCSCNARAQHMDKMGNDWCEQNIATITSWLKEEAEKRSLPFVEWPVKMLVKRAIAASRKAQDARNKI